MPEKRLMSQGCLRVEAEIINGWKKEHSEIFTTKDDI